MQFDAVRGETVSALAIAAHEGNLEMVSKLLAKGRLPEYPDNRGWTPIHAACKGQQLEAFQLMINRYPEKVQYFINLKTWEQLTPMMALCQNESISIPFLLKLLDYGAEVNGKCVEDMTPLHYAAKYKNNKEAVRCLVTRGADVNLQEVNLFTPLHCAIECCCEDDELVEYLVQITNLQLQSDNGQTPLHMACYLGYYNAVQFILKKDKGSINIPTILSTPLVISLKKGYTDIANYLLDNDACPVTFDPVLYSSQYPTIFRRLLSLLKDQKFSDNVLGLFLNIENCSRSCLEVLLEYRSEELSLLAANDCIYNYVLEGLIPLDRTTPDSIITKHILTIFNYFMKLNVDKCFKVILIHNMLNENEYEDSSFLLGALNVMLSMGVTACDPTLVKMKNFIVIYFSLLNVTGEMHEKQQKFLELTSINVLSLKQLSRNQVRKNVSNIKNMLEQQNYIQNLELPSQLKQYLLYQIL